MNSVTMFVCSLCLIVSGCSRQATVAVEPGSVITPVYQVSASADFDSNDDRDRSHFASQLKLVNEDSTREQVTSLLGDPDVTEIDDEQGRETWLYGCQIADELAVLATVGFEDNGRTWKRGTHSPSSDLPDEFTLRALLRFMDETAPTGYVPTDDPLHRIRVANRLIPLGIDKATAVIHEYLSLGHEFANWLHWLVQCLFEVPKDSGFMRPPRIGGYNQELQQETRIPRFPTVIVDDVPFTIFAGAVLAGVPEHVSRYLGEISRQDMRTALFAPSDNPFETLLDLWESDTWPYPYDFEAPPYFRADDETRYKTILLQQALRLVRTVLQKPSTEYRYIYNESAVESMVKSYRDELLELGVVWNVEKQMYTLKDGTAPYPEIKPVGIR